MKKNILLIATALFLFLGNQSVSAQAKMEKETQSTSSKKAQISAKEKTTSLIRTLGLNKKQQEQVYSLYQKTESKMSTANASANAREQGALKAKMDKYIMVEMKEILTKDQYNKYLDMVKKL